jgi:LysR family hydrogen peroxide-inducible transcriptional activator
MQAPSYSLRQLQYAVAVADTGGFRRAAERCHVSQPSLSAQLAQLESALGVTLFERGRRRVLLTPAGADLVERARRVLIEADALAVAAQRFHDPLAGTLRIAIIPTVSPYLLPELAPALRRVAPRLTVVWSEQKTPEVLRDLAAGRLDAAVLAEVARMEDLETEVLADDPFVLAARRDHPLMRARGPARLRDLEGECVLLLEDGHCFREQALALCGKARAREADYTATSLATLAQMVAGGAGITLLPALSVPVENRRGALAVRPFAPPAPSRRLVLAWRRNSPLRAGLTQVAEILRAVARRRR